jgi:hypothetical protein
LQQIQKCHASGSLMVKVEHTPLEYIIQRYAS